MSVSIKEVVSKKDLKNFIFFPHTLYKNNPNWVPPLHYDEMTTLRKKSNPAFDFCEAKYWLAYKENKIAGRIAGIINKRAIQIWGKKHARFGWIDFIDHQEVSSILLSTVEQWAREKGMDGLQGPMGFTDFDKEGMLIEGFNEMGTLVTIYNHAYYPRHLENLDYKKVVDWLEFQFKFKGVIQEKVQRVANIALKRHRLRVHTFKKAKEILPFAKGIFALLNDSYKDLFGFVPLSEKQVTFYTKQYFSFIRPDFLSLVLDNENKVAAVAITMPFLSKALQKANGKIFPFGVIHILRAIKRNDTADLYLIAVRRDLQGKGANAILLNEIDKVFVRNNITIAEAAPQLETNEKVIAQWEHFEHRQHKRRRCFIKHFE
jgi:GNAT superfamily N-acetyltransferase